MCVDFAHSFIDNEMQMLYGCHVNWIVQFVDLN